MTGFAFATIGELSNGYQRRAFSPTEVLADVIRRLEVVEPALNMFAHLDLESARVQACAAEQRMMRGGLLGPLDGIPTSVKDLIAVAGMPQRSGSRTTSAAAVARDAPSIARIRAAGGVILGKSTTSEFGCKAVGDSPLTGITRNPWDTSKTPGGSSAGAAAMVACGLVPYALGTDGGGSLRIPAALTGLYGIKSQFGRVPVFPTWEWAKHGGQAASFETVSLPSRTAARVTATRCGPAVTISFGGVSLCECCRCHRRSLLPGTMKPRGRFGIDNYSPEARRSCWKGRNRDPDTGL